jgi:hypothetical protein
MTLRKWITFGSAAAVMALSACSDRGGSSTGTKTSPGASPGDNSATSQGRRGETPPRARGADAGTDLGTSATPPSDTTGSTGSDTTKK